MTKKSIGAQLRRAPSAQPSKSVSHTAPGMREPILQNSCPFKPVSSQGHSWQPWRIARSSCCDPRPIGLRRLCMHGRNKCCWLGLGTGSLASAAAIMLTLCSTHAQTTTKDLTSVSARDYVRLCGSSENEYPCLGVVYTSATVNRLLDVISNQKTFCPPAQSEFPPSDIVARVTDWLRAQPGLLEKPSAEGLSAALKAMYPCR